MAFQFKIYEIHEEQDGDTLLLVASGEGNNKDEVEKECNHYAMQYSQDYKIKVERNYSYTP